MEWWGEVLDVVDLVWGEVLKTWYAQLRCSAVLRNYVPPSLRQINSFMRFSGLHLQHFDVRGERGGEGVLSTDGE